MTIGNSIEKNGFVYGEKERQLTSLTAGSGPDDGLQGYTSSTVNIRKGDFVYTYDERGRQLASKGVR